MGELNGEKFYVRVAYHHPDSAVVWFGATICQNAYETAAGTWYHGGIETSIKSKLMPNKPDVEVREQQVRGLTSVVGDHRERVHEAV